MHPSTSSTPPRVGRADRAERAALLPVVALGAVLVLVAAAHFYPLWDGADFMQLAKSLHAGLGFTGATGTPDHHHAPAWPALIALLGTHGALAELVSVALLWIVVYAGARLLWTPRVALRALAMTSATSPVLSAVHYGYSEPLAAAVYVALVYAGLYTLRRPQLLPASGLLAGLLYLTKPSLGYTVLVGALAGAAWRVKIEGKRVLRPEYAIAALLCALLVGAWIARNVALFGPAGWETQPYADHALRALLAAPDAARRLAVALAVVLGILVLYAGTGYVAMRGEKPLLAPGETSGLLLGALTPALTAAPMIAAFALAEHQPLGGLLDNATRYSLIGLPAFWTLYAHNKRATWAALAANLLLSVLTRTT